jgi:cell division protein FtsQ
MALMLAGGWLAYPSVWRYLATKDAFKIDEICITGGDHLNQSELQALIPDILGVNLLAVDLAVVESALMKHPWVDNVRVHRRLPSRLVIFVCEKDPVALVTGTSLKALDRAGNLLPMECWHGTIDLPLVHLASGDDSRSRRELLRDLSIRLQALQRRLPVVWQLISEISLDKCDQIELYTSCSRTRILLGKKPTWQQMLNLYTFLIYQGSFSGMDDIELVDLRFRGQVIVRRDRRDT